MQEIGQAISWDELKAAVKKLINNIALVLNKVQPNVFKALNNENLTLLLVFLNKFWMEETYFDEWHEGQIVPVPKSGDLSYPNRGSSFPMMNIVEKIFSSILCARAFKS